MEFPDLKFSNSPAYFCEDKVLEELPGFFARFSRVLIRELTQYSSNHNHYWNAKLPENSEIK